MSFIVRRSLKRQNPNGDRRGYECPEEKDYFPYWHPTEWTDIAVLTHNTRTCNYYRKESQSRKPKGDCVEYYKDEVNGTGIIMNFHENSVKKNF